MQKTRILGIMVHDRIKEAGRTQEILTKYASVIRTRLGFHELSREKCSRVGTILLVLQGDPQQWDRLQEELRQIGGIEMQTMQFANHD
jgi:metal-responsive CopG/Arc/MetJ family transcriptional regulator